MKYGPGKFEVSMNDDLKAWIDRFEEAERAGTVEPCKYGHLGCSTTRGGRCMDETLSQILHDEPDYEEN